MSATMSHLSRSSRVEEDPDDLLLHIRDLVVVRNVLAARGATAAELQECDAVIGSARERLAESVKRGSAVAAAA